MSRSTVDWVAPLLLLLALRAVAPPTLSSDTEAAPIAAAASRRASPEPADAEPTAEPAVAKPCYAPIAKLFAESHMGLALPLPVGQAVIVTLPDPVDTPAASVFDSGIEAIVTGFSSLRYVRDHFYLPWSARTEDEERASWAGCPGVMLFRPLDLGNAPIAVLVIGESSTWGVDKLAFANALGLIATDAPGAPPLRILGPYYSGTAWTLSAHLARSGAAGGYRVASGSLSAPSEAALMKAALGVRSFDSFAPPIDRRRDEVLEFLGFGANGARPAIAVLQESGTVYGQRQAKVVPSQPKVTLLQVEYPPNVSALRDAYVVLERSSGAAKPESGRRSELPAAVEQRAKARDMVPVFATEHSVVIHDLALRDVADVLAERRIGDAIVTGVLPQDVVFLSQRLKRSTPDLRVIFYSMDRLFTHSDYASELRGSLVVTPFALLDERLPELRTTLSRDQARGIYHALRHLFDKRDELPPLSVGVLSRGKLWPIAVEPGAAVEPAVEVPASFWLVSVAVLALALLHSVLMLRVPSGAAAVARGRAGARLLALLRRVEDHAVGRSRAWFLSGLRPCRDPLVRPWHALMSGVAQAALAAVLLITAVLWWMIALQRAPGDGAEQGLRIAFAVAAVLCLLIAVLTLGQHARGLLGALLHRPPAAPAGGAGASAPGGDREAELLRRTRRWALRLALLLGAVIAAVALLSCAGLSSVAPHARALFLSRALELNSGVSPLLIVLLCLAFAYCVALTQAARLRILDVGDELVQGERKRHMLFRAVEDRQELLQRERALYEAALLPGGIRYLVGVCAMLALPILIVLHVRPSAFHRPHDFTLENGLLSAAMAGAILLCLGVTVVTTLQVLRLWKHLTEVLQALAASDLADSFARVPSPLRRTVAEQLALGPQDESELTVALRALRSSAPEPAAVRRPGMRTSLAWTESFSALLEAAAAARARLGAPHLSAKERDALRRGLATYVTFGLVRWVKQFRFLMWLATLGTATLLIASSLYVFSVRRLLVTVFVVLTVLVVMAGASVFAGLERDRVLSRIGDTAPGKITFHGNLLRILGWGVLPVSLAVASYYPDAVRHLLTWGNAFGVMR